MSCSSYRVLISRYIDDALPETERKQLLGHIQSCPRCAATLAQYRAMGTVLRKASGAGIRLRPGGFNGVMGALSTRRPEPRFRWPLVNRSLAVTAAVLMAMTILSVATAMHVPAAPGSVAVAVVESSQPAGRPTADDIAPRKVARLSREDVLARSPLRRGAEDEAIPLFITRPGIGEQNGQALPYLRPETVAARPSRPFIVGYAPAGQAAATPSNSSPHNDLAQMYASLGDNLAWAGSPLSLAGSLPSGALIERVALERSAGQGQAYRLEVVFSLANGTRYRLQEFNAEGVGASIPGLVEEGALVAGGRTWKYGHYTVRSAPAADVIWVLRSTSGSRTTILEAAAPLEEIIQTLDGLR